MGHLISAATVVLIKLAPVEIATARANADTTAILQQ
jgi:hypothetical protein